MLIQLGYKSVCLHSKIKQVIYYKIKSVILFTFYQGKKDCKFKKI